MRISDWSSDVCSSDLIFACRQPAVEHVHLPLHLHRIAIDRIFLLDGRIGIEMAEAAAQKGRAAHLPHQPRQRQIGSASSRERVGQYVKISLVAGQLKKKNKHECRLTYNKLTQN